MKYVFFGLRANYYPPMDEGQDGSGAGRLLGHEDVDLFTILPAARVEGLQVWNHRSRAWVRMNAPPGSRYGLSGSGRRLNRFQKECRTS